MEKSLYGNACLSFDADWAPEFILDDLFELLRGAQVPFTLFCTHDSPAVHRLGSLKGAELAIHPNLHQADDEFQTLSHLKGLFPCATGVRNHKLYYHSGLLEMYHQLDLVYLSNDLLFGESNLRPYYDWAGILRLPIYFEDDVYCLVSSGGFEPSEFHWDYNGLKVFNFHPVHVYLNTHDFDDYLGMKEHIRVREQVRAARWEGRGCRTFLLELLAQYGSAFQCNMGEFARRYTKDIPAPAAYRAYLNQKKG